MTMSNDILVLTLLLSATAFCQNPPCLTGCMAAQNIAEVSYCSPVLRVTLLDCLENYCSLSSTSAVQRTIDSLQLSYSPKAQYSCQQSILPGGDGDAAGAVTLPLNTSCSTSPYGFNSFVPHTNADMPALAGAMAACGLMLYAGPDCEGTSQELGMKNGLQTEQCIFHGGRSAQVQCRAGEGGIGAAESYVASLCGGPTSYSIGASNTAAASSKSSSLSSLSSSESSKITALSSAASSNEASAMSTTPVTRYKSTIDGTASVTSAPNATTYSLAPANTVRNLTTVAAATTGSPTASLEPFQGSASDGKHGALEALYRMVVVGVIAALL